MKRKILSLLLCISMLIAMLAGCGTKDVDATSDKVTSSSSVEKEDDKNEDSEKKEDDTVNETKKLEKQYIERLEAYQEYYEQELDDYEYELYARVTVNKEGLPLLWLCYSLDEDPDSAQATQLLSYEDEEVKVLAELRNICACPLVSDEAVAAMDFNEDFIYIYDADNALFKKVEVSDGDYQEYINENIEEFSYYNYCIWINEEEQELSYIGKTNGEAGGYGDSSEAAVSEDGAAASVTNTDGVSISVDAAVTNTDVEDADVAPEITQPQISEADEEIVDSEEDYQKFYYADGSEGSWEEAKDELKNCERNRSGELRIAEGGVEWLTEFDADTMFRVLKSQPAHSSEQLFMILASNGLYFENSDDTVYSIGEPINLKEYK